MSKIPICLGSSVAIRDIGILAVLSFLCFSVDSVPQTDLLGVGIHTFSSAGIFEFADLPRLPHPLPKRDARKEERSVV